MASLARLLDLQDLDVRIDQFLHRKANLPERAEVAQRKAALAKLASDMRPIADQRATLARDQQRLEDEANALAAKAAAEDKRLYSGTISSPRELQAIQEEIASLKRRQSDLEDKALEVIEAIEPLDAELAAAAQRKGSLDAELADLAQRIAAAEAEIDADLVARRAERDALAAELGAAVVQPYDALRARMGGVAVAKLEAGSCRGCHLKLSAVDFARIQREPVDAVVYCEQCGRILIR